MELKPIVGASSLTDPLQVSADTKGITASRMAGVSQGIGEGYIEERAPSPASMLQAAQLYVERVREIDKMHASKMTDWSSQSVKTRLSLVPACLDCSAVDGLASGAASRAVDSTGLVLFRKPRR